MATFEELNAHWGHNIEVVRYGNENVGTVNVAIECVDCGVVLIDFDREE